MFSRKQLALVGLILMLFGLAGSLLTYRISYPKEGVVEEQSITESFAAIDVRSNHAKVEIMPTDENEATIVLRGNIRKNSGYQFSTEIKEETLIVHAKVSKRKFFQFFPKYLVLEVHVPKQTYDRLHVENKNGKITVAHVEAADIHLATENGIVAMHRISANRINALTDNGKVKGENVETETFEATTENGSVEGKRIHANTLDLTTENGEIRLFEVTGDIFGKTKNGSIFIEVTDLDRSLDLSTTNGRIDIKSAEKPTNASIHAFVKNGSIDIFGDKKPHTVIGDGKHQIHLETENGSIKLGGR